MQALSGALIRQRDTVVIGVNSRHSEARRRFTVAHELGHLVLRHQGASIHIDQVMMYVSMRDSISSKAIDPNEIEANRFAAELLMPEPFLREDIGRATRHGVVDMLDDDFIRKLATRYKVSIQAMAIRLENLGFASLAAAR
jgi:Zn-dependent peptidase ImmA (M78 family)